MLEKITLTPPFTAAECTFWQNVFGGIAAAYPAEAVSHSGTTTTGAPITAAVAQTIDYFPADPTQAPAPSPENSQILILGETIGGPSYLKDSAGNIYALTLTGASAIGPAGGVVVINGVAHPDTNNNFTSLIVRQGQVWLIATGGQVQTFAAAQGSIYNATLPPAWLNGVAPTAAQTAATAAAASAANLVPPVPNAIAPGSSGKVLQVGPGQTYATISAALAAAADGDTVSLAAGTYTEALPKIATAILLTGPVVTLDSSGTIAPTVTLDFSSYQSAQLAGGGLGGISFKNDGVVANLAVTGAGIHDTSAQLCSGIRTEGGYLTVKSCLVSGNQVGVGQGGANCVVTIEGSRVEQNGIDGQSHDVYVGGGGQGTLIVNGSLIVAPKTAHAVKSRFPVLIANGSTFESPNGSCIDLPDGVASATLTDCTLIKLAGADDHQIITVGEESRTAGTGNVSITGGTIDALCDNPLLSVTAGTITLTGVTLTGNPITAPNGNIVGLAAAA